MHAISKFEHLKVGDHFTLDSSEDIVGEKYIKVFDIVGGCPPYTGIVNAVSYRGQPSGMGSHVLVKLLEEYKWVPHENWGSRQLKQFEDTLANIKQLSEDNYRAKERLVMMAATVYALFAHLTRGPGHEYGD